jgi:hypothetical protein
MRLQSRNLSVQMQGEDVKILQSELRRLGFTIPAEETERETFGLGTHQAVVDLQEKYGLATTGVVDQHTADLINAAVEALSPLPPRFAVKGKVSLKGGSPLPAVLVKAFDKDLRREELLGEATTDQSRSGDYEIGYTAEQFRRAERKSADLIVRAFDQKGTLLGASDVIFNARQIEEVNLVVAMPEEPVLSEFEKLMAVLSPVLQGVQPADLTDGDVAFLVGETKIKRLGIEILRQAALLARQTNLPTEVFYGFARQDLPLDLDDLLGNDSEALRAALAAAIKERIIPAGLRESLDEILQRLEQLRSERGLLERRRLVGQLIDQADDAPLAGFTVRGFDLDAGSQPKELGHDITSVKGLFELAYSLPRQTASEPETGRNLRLHILDRQGKEIHQTELHVTGKERVVKISVPVPEAAEPPSLPLHQLAEDLQLTLPQGLLTKLEANGIRTLADIRKAGGLGRLEDLPVPADHPKVRLLEAHANLSVLSSDYRANAALIERGFDGLTAIASKSRAGFIRQVREEMGAADAVRLYEMAKAEAHYLDNVLMGLKVDWANGFPSKIPGITNPMISEWFPLRCRCPDCEAAVSPLAYLADLLGYTLTHLKKEEGAEVTLQDLSVWFHQRFDELPASCDQLERLFRQVRLCIEVLRLYTASLPLSVTIQDALAQAENEYLLLAYQTLLNRLGTSYEEIRLAHLAEQVQRERLAARLGIPGPENLEALCLVPGEFDEVDLEALFGLRRTGRAPFSDPPVPQFQTWRLETLRQRWQAEDWPPEDPPGALPLIDPDLIGPADLKHPVATDRAFALWQARRAELADRRHEIGDRAGVDLSDAVAFATGVTLADLQALETRLAGGENVENEIAEHGLQLPGFRRILAIADLDAGGGPVLDSEWQEFYDILLQAWKVLHYPDWRVEERGDDADPDRPPISLSPDYFRLADTEPELAAWRASQASRREWRSRLRARIDQEQSVIDGLQEAVDVAEETTLPLLRDGLIAATGKQAKELSELLLIDCQTAPCHRTTRIAQAIETIQSLLFGVRTGQLIDAFPEVYLDNLTTFDEEWKWLGSYATWRAAMFVFMYPENILLPHLRSWQTPAFRQLVRELRDNRQLTPEQACDAATRYADYFRDVSNLIIEASVQVRVSWTAGDCRGAGEVRERVVVFLFARGGTTQTVYASWYDTAEDATDIQSPWEPVPGLANALNIVGAAVHEPAPGKLVVHVFARLDGDGSQKLVYNTYDVHQGRWHEEVIELDPPEGAEAFAAVVKQSHSAGVPQLAVKVGRSIYTRSLNLEGTGWEEPDWQYLVMNTAYSDLVAMLELNGTESILITHPRIIVNGRGHLRYRLLSKNRDDGQWRPWIVVWGTVEWAGGFVWPDTDLAYLFWRTDISRGCHTFQPGNLDGTGEALSLIDFAIWLGSITGLNILPEMNQYSISGSTVSLGFAVSLANLAFLEEHYEIGREQIEEDIKAFVAGLEESAEWQFACTTVKQLTVDSLSLEQVLEQYLDGGTVSVKNREDDEIQSVDGIDYERIVYAQGSPGRAAYDNAGLYRTVLTPSDGNRLVESNTVRVAPRVIAPYEYSIGLSSEQLQHRRFWIALAFEINEGAPAPVQAYLEEAWYFVPVHVALQLQKRRQFVAALDWLRSVYDYTRQDLDERNIYCGLVLGNDPAYGFERAKDWLGDPLNPHAIAITRASAYTRFTIMTLVGCLLDYADNVESLPRARMLYETALKLLDLPELKQREDLCSPILDGTVLETPGLVDPAWHEPFRDLFGRLGPLDDARMLGEIGMEIEELLELDAPIEDRYGHVERRVAEALAEQPERPTYADVIENQGEHLHEAHMALLSRDGVSQAVDRVGMQATAGVDGALDFVFGARGDEEPDPDQRWLWGMPDVTDPDAGMAWLPIDRGAAFENLARLYPGLAFDLWLGGPRPFFIAPLYEFCIPPNPVLNALRQHATINLQKLRNCRNIAGMERSIEPYAAPTDVVSGMPIIGAGGQVVIGGAIAPAPTPYRYEYLIERAKHLIDRAAQMEAAFLAALEKRDAEYYNLMKARQDIQLARAGVRLQDLRLREAQDGVRMAELQRDRAQIQSEYFTQLLEEGVSPLEMASLALMQGSVFLQLEAANMSFLAAALPASISIGFPEGGSVSFSPQGSVSAIASAYSSLAGALSTQASILSTLASYQRRAQEWEFQRNLAQQDMRIGAQQCKLASDRVDIVSQEQTISKMQADHAEASAEFLANKFTNVELYDWMGNILEGIYSLFLQQATAVARLAETQLAFERQEAPSGIVQGDYWEAFSDDVVSIVPDGDGPNRRGLTGSARLLADTYKLDQYRFETEQRKLQLTKTISLAQVAPAEFQRFRETGVIPFYTPMEMFDRDFPGHYLRLIKRVRISVIALVPAVAGIKATLSSTGISRVVTSANGMFHSVEARRATESIALTSPRDATGLFELNPLTSEMLLPFEGLGVDTAWEFRMPRAANRFDYRTIADVLITIEYTALDSPDYKQQVIRSLDPNLSADRPFSFRHQFPDQWYDLHNPDQTSTPMIVRFETRREDFPPNIDELAIQEVVLYFARAAGRSFEVRVTHLKFTAQNGYEFLGSGADSIDGVVSTRRGNAGDWTYMIGQTPFGEWELALLDNLADGRQPRELFQNEEIEDILFVITYSARTPEWPA